MDFPHEQLDFDKKRRRLAQFDDGLNARLQEALGEDWRLAKLEDKERLLTPRQRDWYELRYFVEASIVNSGDLFGYLDRVYSRPELFEQIDAVQTLAAAEELRQLHDQYTQLAAEDEKNEFWHQTREQREPIEQKAEDFREFADLLIRFAERHPEEFPEFKEQDVSQRVFPLWGSLRRMAENTEHETKNLDEGPSPFHYLWNYLSDHEQVTSQQEGAGQSNSPSESMPEGKQKDKPESEGNSK